MSAIQQLKDRLGEVCLLGSINAVLGWDQQTYMPERGTPHRARQLAWLSKAQHEMHVSDVTAKLLAAAEAEGKNLDADSDDAAYLRVARREFDKKAKLPVELVKEMTEVAAIAHEAWVEARAENNFAKFAPILEKTLELQRRMADLLGWKHERYDALLDLYEPGMLTADARKLFAELKTPLVKLVKDIAAQPPVDASVLTRAYDEEQQRVFAEDVIRQFGFDFTRGRQDRTAHPFCTTFARDDVRITTRYDRNFLPMALFGTLHETGHALYELNIAERFDGNILGTGVSSGIHESQSRLWENVVGRSPEFWQHYYGKLQKTFPVLADVTEQDFYRAINRVQPSLIRVEADEVTYNLHIMIRFELEVELIEGRLSVADAPAAWRAKYKEYLGIEPPTDSDGILQDVHWSFGGFGYFPTYTLGNILSVQFAEAADQSLGGELRQQIARGEFAPLREWLTQHVHQYGSKYMPDDLTRRATGRSLDVQPYLNYLQNKFGAIYGINGG